MAVSGEVLRGFLEYVQDLGERDVYRREVPSDAAAQAALLGLIRPNAAFVQPVATRAQTGAIPAQSSAVAPQAAPGTQRPAPRRMEAPPARRERQPAGFERQAPTILIQPQVTPRESLASVAAAAGDAEEFTATSLPHTGSMTPPGFNQLAPLPASSVPPAQRDAALQTLRATIGDCTRCPLAYAGRHSIVFGDGNATAKLMFVGEGPGADEDASGVPFVGKAGQLLNNMIGAMGLKRDEVYIANIVKCRPPKNRVPEPVEANTCSQFLLQQIDIVQPQIIVALGSTAATYLLGVKQSLAGLRGQWHDVRGAKCAVTYHPAYLLRDPRMKGETWKDLQRVMAELKLQPPARGGSAGSALPS